MTPITADIQPSPASAHAWQDIVFISDLHLSARRPQTVAAFSQFCSALNCEALFVLGDLFDYWIGDDAPDPVKEPVIASFRELHARGISCYFVAGNRDFLVGPAFAEQAHITLLPAVSPLQLGDTTVLILHGDELCTDDTDYQLARKMFRDPHWQAQFLALSLQERIKQAMALRERSDMAKQEKSEEIMDVNQAAVNSLIRSFATTRRTPVTLIHGHTHRPAKHDLNIDGNNSSRWVLADWPDNITNTDEVPHIRFRNKQLTANYLGS